MPVGSHKDAFKAHQLVKKLISEQQNPYLAQKAAEILLDFVKSARQVNSDHVLETLPDDPSQYDLARLDKALNAVDNLCGKCDESHEDACFVNQTRRILIAAKTGVDLGPKFDGKKNLSDLLKEASELIGTREKTSPNMEQTSAADKSVFIEHNSPDQVKFLKELEDMKEKDVFRSTLIDEIVQTISKVAEGDFAAEMPVHDDRQLGKLATAFNLMLETVNHTMQNLDSLVAERSAEMRMIMNTVPVGLLSLDENYRITPEYSTACETILDLKDLRGRNFFDVIGLTKRRADERKQLADFLDLFKKQLLPEEDMAPLNPFQEIEIFRALETDSMEKSTYEGEERRKSQRLPQPRWLKINYHIIDRGGDNPCHILVVLEDISRAKAMAEEIKKSDRDNMQLRSMAENPDLFCEFLEEALNMVSMARHHIDEIAIANDPRSLVNEVFRTVHTIKGTAASLNLFKISDLSAELENRLSDLRNHQTIDQAVIEQTGKDIAKLSEVVNDAVNRTKELLGREIGAGDNDIQVQVSSRGIKHLANRIKEMTIEPSSKEMIIDQLMGFRALPVKKALGRSLKIVPGLIERLEKNVMFDLIDHQTRIDCEMGRKLNTAIVHILRNAFDHGIESDEQRYVAGKSEQGNITLEVNQDDANLIVTIADDGKGLDPHLLKESAIKKGFISASEADSLTEQQCFELIFRPGFSSAEVVSDVSGRGVGMDAVLDTIRNLQGDIQIDSSLGKGTRFTITLPKSV